MEFFFPSKLILPLEIVCRIMFALFIKALLEYEWSFPRIDAFPIETMPAEFAPEHVTCLSSVFWVSNEVQSLFSDFAGV